jgi:hypothetical protein
MKRKGRPLMLGLGRVSPKKASPTRDSLWSRSSDREATLFDGHKNKSPHNLALRKVARQSSDGKAEGWHTGKLEHNGWMPACNAVDGDIGDDSHGGTVHCSSHTSLEDQPWLEVDLGASCQIDEVSFSCLICTIIGLSCE